MWSPYETALPTLKVPEMGETLPQGINIKRLAQTYNPDKFSGSQLVQQTIHLYKESSGILHFERSRRLYLEGPRGAYRISLIFDHRLSLSLLEGLGLLAMTDIIQLVGDRPHHHTHSNGGVLANLHSVGPNSDDDDEDQLAK